MPLPVHLPGSGRSLLASRRVVRLGLVAATAALLLGGAAAPALAAFTDSEKAQIRDYYARGRSDGAPRVRALLARTDLSAAESAEAFTEAARRVAFDDRHEIFLENLLFGPATQAARSDLVPTVVAGLLARSAELAAATSDEGRRADELVRIHRFVQREIASGGKPPRDGHDDARAIRADALRAAAQAYRAHLALPVFERARLAGPMLAARLQAEVALVELASGLVPSADIASWISADPTERSLLERTGLVSVGLATAPPAKANAVQAMIGAVPSAIRGASVLWLGKPWPRGVSARRDVLVAQAPLAGTKSVPGGRLWSSAVDPAPVDGALREVAFVLGRAAARTLTAEQAGFGALVQATLTRARAAGDAGFLAVATLDETLDEPATGDPPLSELAFVGRSVELLLLDAPRALSVAMARAVGGRFEPMEQLVLALGCLALGDGGALRDHVTAGRPGEGTVVPLEVTRIRGRGLEIDAFTVDGHEIVVTRGPGGAITKVERDGKAPSLSTIPFGRVPAAPGEQWAVPPSAARPKGTKSGEAPQILRRLFGRPEVGFVDDGRILVRSSAIAKGRDAVVAPGTGDDVDVELDLGCVRAPCAVVLRASAGKTGYAGIAIFVEPTDPPRAWVVALDGQGGRFPLTDPTPLAKTAGPQHIQATLGTDGVKIRVGDRRLSAALPTFLLSGGGDVALAPGERGELEVRGFSLRRTTPKAPKKQ